MPDEQQPDYFVKTYFGVMHVDAHRRLLESFSPQSAMYAILKNATKLDDPRDMWLKR